MSDEDWRGIEREWLQRVWKDLSRGLERNRGRGPFGFGRDDPEFQAAREEYRRYRETVRRIPRFISRDPGMFCESPAHDFAPPGMLAELGGARRWDSQNLTVHELMEEFVGAEAEGVALIQRLLLLGFARRHYPGLEETHRYYCRDADDRAGLRAQFIEWLRGQEPAPKDD